MRKVKYKAFAGIISIVVLVMALAGCGSVSLPRPEALEGVPAHEVTGSCDISIDGDVITVSGETDIMDGALIDISVVGQDSMVIDHVTVTKNGDTMSHEFTITDELYDGVDAVVGYITFAPTIYGKQPEAVFKTYGDDFEYIVAGDGNYIWDKNGIIVLYASEMLPLEK